MKVFDKKAVKLTGRQRYALTAMVVLANHGRETPMPLPEVKAASGISASYLDKIFGDFRRLGLLKSIRGPGGGYVLAKPPGEISIADILMSCNDGHSESSLTTSRKAVSTALLEAEALRNKIEEMLDATLRHVFLAEMMYHATPSDSTIDCSP